MTTLLHSEESVFTDLGALSMTILGHGPVYDLDVRGSRPWRRVLLRIVHNDGRAEYSIHQQIWPTDTDEEPYFAHGEYFVSFRTAKKDFLSFFGETTHTTWRLKDILLCVSAEERCIAEETNNREVV